MKETQKDAPFQKETIEKNARRFFWTQKNPYHRLPYDHKDSYVFVYSKSLFLLFVIVSCVLKDGVLPLDNKTSRPPFLSRCSRFFFAWLFAM